MKKLFFLVFMFAAKVANANVDMRTGNFYTTFTDVLFDKDIDLKIVRVYNAQSEYRGIFGYGWSSNFETHLEMLSDGGILIHDFGGGSKTYFYKSPQAPDGTVFESKQFGYEVLTKTSDGFKRLTHEGTYEYFDNEGYLTEIIDRVANQQIFISYNSQHMITGIKDNQEHELQVDYNEDNLVKQITGTGIGASNYAYIAVGPIFFLKESRDINNDGYSYTYNSNNKMTSISHGGLRTNIIEYDDKSRTLKEYDGDGSYIEYVYDEDRHSSDLHFTRKSRKYKNGHLISTITKEFDFKKGSNGQLLLTNFRMRKQGENGSAKMKIKSTGLPDDDTQYDIFDD